VASLEITPNDQGEPQAQLIFHNTDHLTSSNVDTDSDGQVIQLLDYFPYGKTRIDDHAENYANDYQFTGKERDQETDLSYFEARYYDSSIGRFISQDPAFKDSPENFLEDPQQLNPYSYARNNPLRYNDPSGESIEDIRQRLDAIHAWALDLQRQINEFANNAQQAVFNGFVGLLPQVQENPMVNNPQNRMFANYQGQLYINPAVGSTAFGLAAIMAGSKTVPASRATGLLDIAENRLLSAAERKIISDSIQDQKLRNIFNEFYQSSDALPGGTAGAIKHTVKTGELVHGSDHFIKGDGFVNGLNKLLQNFSLNQEDRAIAQKLFDQLKNSKK